MCVMVMEGEEGFILSVMMAGSQRESLSRLKE